MFRHLLPIALLTIPLQVTAQSSSANASPGIVQLTYFGTAGWQISDDKTIILVDPSFPESTGRRRQAGAQAASSPETLADPTGGTISPCLTKRQSTRTSRRPISF